MKKNLILVILLIGIAVSMAEEAKSQSKAQLQAGQDDDSEDPDDFPNPFKGDEDVEHSLYQETNRWNRISGDTAGVPEAKYEYLARKFPNPDAYVAFKVARFYNEVFTFIDATVQDYLSPDDITATYVSYGWPLPDGVPADEYVPEQVKKHDFDKDGKLNLVEFSRFMEDTWKVAEWNQERRCQAALAKAVSVMEKLFDFLDVDKSGKISKDEVNAGLSYVLNKDIPSEDLDLCFQDFDDPETALLDQSQFILAMVNNVLSKNIVMPADLPTFFEKKQ